MNYHEFLDRKAQLGRGNGFEPTDLPEHLFPFQRDLVNWAVRQGRGAIFADCGMGKTAIELAWATNVYRHTGKPVLIVTPLAVSFQIATEAVKFGVDAAVSRDGTIETPIAITNYEQLEKFTPADFGGMVCDESSAIKSFDGKRRAVVTEFMRRIPYRLLGTATAAPNDYIELGTSSEALGELGHIDMLNRFFINKNRTSDTKVNRSGKFLPSEGSGWRFKGHAEMPFWRWMSSWARAIRKPSDYGYDDGAFVLPPLIEKAHVVEAFTPDPDALFDVPVLGLQEERKALRRTLADRCEYAAELLADDGIGVAWCQLNDESSMLTKLIDGAVELTGSASADEKEEKLAAFTRGEIRVLVTKPSIGAWGLNWQHCHRMTYFPSHSYEQYYQSVRRCWRFGQTMPVVVHTVTTTSGERILDSLRRKSAQADGMFSSLIAHMNDAIRLDQTNDYINELELPAWL